MTTTLDDALTLLLANQAEGALRASIPVLARAPSATLPLMVTSRALGRLGRRRAASDGLAAAVERAIASGDLLLALAAMEDLRALGVDVAAWGDRVARAFCRGGDGPRRAPDHLDLGPLGPFLPAGAVASHATQLLYEAIGSEGVASIPLPLFGELGEEALRALIDTLDVVTVPAGHRVVSEGEQGDAAYFVASGELEIVRLSGDTDSWRPVPMARVTDGALCGEMAILAQLPSAASIIALRPSILLVAHHDALARVAGVHAEIAAALTAHCRRSAVGNVGGLTPMMAAIPARERALLVDRLQLRLFRRDEIVLHQGEEPAGFHLLLAGTAAVTIQDASESLAAGATIGDMEVVLCKRAANDVVATTDVATLFLPRDEFFALAQEHPAIVHGMYGLAVQRYTRTPIDPSSLEEAVVDDEVIMNVSPPPPLPGTLAPEDDDPASVPEEPVEEELTFERVEVEEPSPAEPTVIVAAHASLPPELPSRSTPTERRIALPASTPALDAAPPPPRLSAALILSDTMRPASTSVPPVATSSSDRGAPWSKVALQGVAIAAVVAAVFTARGQRTDTAPAGAAAALPEQAAPLPAPVVPTAPVLATPSASASAPPAATVAPPMVIAVSSLPRSREVSTHPKPHAAPAMSTAPSPKDPTRAGAASDEFGGRE